MKKRRLMTCGVLLIAGMLALGSCDDPAVVPGPGTDDPTDPNDPVNTEEFVDTRVDLFTAVSAQMTTDGVVPDGEEVNFKSLYEAANYLYENCDHGSYVKLLGDETNTPLFQIRQSQASISGDSVNDQWFYYVDGSTLDGYSEYMTGDTEFLYGQKVSRIMMSSSVMKETYQPYSLIAREGHGDGTQAWNRLPLLDTSVRYNPQAFVGLRSITFSFDLTEARIRPSYNTQQKAVPTITLSSTDSYNWSNQGIYMDTDNGNWYYLHGETQSDIKSLEYSEDEVLFTSTWNRETQEYTPDADVTMTLEYVYDTENEVWRNDLTLVVKGETTTTHNFSYEYISMNGRGTPRANVSLDLISDDETYMEGEFAPDFMCGAYFKDIVVTEGKGTVPEGLTPEEYQSDLTDGGFLGEAGATYDLLASAMGADNVSNVEIILDHYDAITYNEEDTRGDVFTISYEQRASEKVRTDAVADCEALIARITDEDTADSAIVIRAAAAYSALTTLQQRLVRYGDRYTALEEALER